MLPDYHKRPSWGYGVTHGVHCKAFVYIMDTTKALCQDESLFLISIPLYASNFHACLVFDVLMFWPNLHSQS
jgi:hypothetical protein